MLRGLGDFSTTLPPRSNGPDRSFAVFTSLGAALNKALLKAQTIGQSQIILA